MLFLPQECCTKVISNIGIVGTANPPGTAVPENNGVANNYGGVTELISAANNTQDSWGIEILVSGTGASAAASQATVDILIGGATDDILIKALICGHAYNSGIARYFFPLHIPAGLRLAAQMSSPRVGITDPRVMVWLYGGGNPPFKVGGKVTTYGTQIDNSRGQAVTPAASGGAASVTQMTASSTANHFYFMPGFQISTDTTITPLAWINVGIGVGAATEERIGTWLYCKDTTEMITGPVPFLGAFRDVPSGTRLSLLVSNGGANDAAHDGLIYAVS